MSARHAMTFAAAQARYDAMLPPEDDHADAVEREAERIAADADKVRELVLDNLGTGDDPGCDADWAADTIIVLRNARPIFSALCNGYSLEQAMRLAPGADAFRKLLRSGERADEWINKLIDQAASQAVDDAIADDMESRAEGARDARDMEGWA